MRFGTLASVALPDLTNVFNAAFANYFVPLQLTESQLAYKLHRESIDLNYSPAAFDDNVSGFNGLVGFVLHGVRRINGSLIVYNGGTGVIPSHRGMSLTVKMYDFILPFLRSSNVNQCLLEVIDGNAQAIKSYERIGFTKTRLLNAYKGTLENAIEKTNTGISIKPIEHPDWNVLQHFRDWNPTWQNDDESIQRSENHITLGAYVLNDSRIRPNDLVGYINYNTQSLRIAQLAVKKEYRCRGIASALLKHIVVPNKSHVLYVNVDSSDNASNQFFGALGFDILVKQYEMKMTV